MPSPDRRLLDQRLHNQRLAASALGTPAVVVEWLGAVQAQDFSAARWAVGQRLATASDEAVLEAFDTGAILRTHVLRPTWHFVTPADIRWMLDLTAPRVQAACAFQYRQAGLTARAFAKSHGAIARALDGGQHLTRKELAVVLARAGIPATGVVLGLVMLQAELEAVVCSGARRGTEQTYALLAERVPGARTLRRDEALAELARRYFQSHGPATAADFAWWSGLTIRDAKAGIAAATPPLDRVVVDGRDYWHAGVPPTPRPKAAAHLLPNFDEYTVAYRDRRLLASDDGAAARPAMEMLSNVIIIAGRIAGTWRRTVKGSATTIAAHPYRSFTATESRLVTRASQRYARFLGTSATLSLTTPTAVPGPRSALRDP